MNTATESTNLLEGSAVKATVNKTSRRYAAMALYDSEVARVNWILIGRFPNQSAKMVVIDLIRENAHERQT